MPSANAAVPDEPPPLALAWLAWQLRQDGRPLFLIEDMHPRWLPAGRRWLPTWGLACAIGLVVALAVAQGAAFATRLMAVAVPLARAAPAVGLLAGLLTALLLGVWPWQLRAPSARTDGSVATPALLLALGGALLGGAVISLDLELVRGRLAVLGVGSLRWAWSRDVALLGAACGLTALLGAALPRALDAAAPLSGPGAAIRRLTRHALATGFGTALAAGGSVALALRLGERLVPGPEGGMVGGVVGWSVLALGGSIGLATPLLAAVAVAVGCAVGMLAALGGGGLAVLRYRALRWAMVAARLPLPARDRELAAELDALVARGVLQRVGGGWGFVDGELRDQLAERWVGRRENAQ